MSEFKFACPVCRQHINTDASASGTTMECPTCFRKLIVPQPPAKGTSHLIVTALEVGKERPAAKSANEKEPEQAQPVVVKRSLVLPIVMALAVGAAGATVFLLKDKIFKSSSSESSQTNAVAGKKPSRPQYVPPANDTNWTLNLAGIQIPDTKAYGRIDGYDFTLQQAILQGGTLTLRQGTGKTADLAMVLNLFANQGEDLAGQSFTIEPTVEKAAKLTLRWKDEDNPGKTINKPFTKGYALRLEFGEVNGKRITGKLYLCTPDKGHSFIAGTFDAEIRKPAPPKDAKTGTGTTTKPKTKPK